MIFGFFNYAFFGHKYADHREVTNVGGPIFSSIVMNELSSRGMDEALGLFGGLFVLLFLGVGFLSLLRNYNFDFRPGIFLNVIFYLRIW